MHNDFEQKLKSVAGGSLSAEERTRMRRHLLQYMAENPLPAGGLSRASYWSLPVRRTQTGSQLSWSLYLSRAGAFAALVLMAGGGVSLAAENALPGNPLYAVKRSINEPVRAALAVSIEAKASWSAEEAVRRLGEAEQLASRGTLTAETAQNLGADFERSAQAAAQRIATLKETRPDDAAVAATKLSASLSAHESILGALGNADGASDVQAAAVRVRGDLALSEGGAFASDSASVTATMKAAPATTLSIQVETSAEIAPEAPSFSGGESVAAFRRAALEARADAAEKFRKARRSLSEEEAAKVAATLAEADASLSRADTAYADGQDSSLSAREYQEVLRGVQSLSVVLKAAGTFKLPALFGREETPTASGTPGILPSSGKNESSGRAIEKRNSPSSGSGGEGMEGSSSTATSSSSESSVESSGSTSVGVSSDEAAAASGAVEGGNADSSGSGNAVRQIIQSAVSPIFNR